MGYYIDQKKTSFRMKSEDLTKAYEAIRLLGVLSAEKKGDNKYSWVDPNFISETDFISMMGAWRWEVKLDPTNNVIDISFQGDKYGDDDILFAAIAPFVEKGSFIEMQGEDGAMWRWIFNGKTCVQKSAKVSWD